MVGTLHLLASALYIGAAAVLATSLATGRAGVPRSAALLVTAAFLAHAAGLATFAARFGELPLVGLGPSLSTFAFLIGGFLFPVAWTHQGARQLGLVLAPLAALLIGGAVLAGLAPAGEPLAFRGGWFTLHVLLAFVAYASLAVAFAAGLLYLIQFRELKSKRLGRWFRFLPSLEALDRVGRRALLTGFPALTVALLLGWAWTVRFLDSLEATDPKVIWSVLTWIVFATGLVVRYRGVGRDRRAALVSVVGFVLVIVSYILLRITTAQGRVFF